MTKLNYQLLSEQYLCLQYRLPGFAVFADGFSWFNFRISESYIIQMRPHSIFAYSTVFLALPFFEIMVVGCEFGFPNSELFRYVRTVSR